MSKVAILGAGAMGSRMARALLRAGHEVVVWNRTSARAAALGDAGATIAVSPRIAATGADFVISMVRDDEASRAVWTNADAGALAAMGDGVAIESSTLSLGWTRELTGLAQVSGVKMLDAPVVGSRPQADAGQLIYLAGGDATVLAAAQPILLTMGGAVHHAGPAGAGTAMKLAINALFAIQVAALAECLASLQASDVSLERAVEILGATPVCSPAAEVAAASMLSRRFAPLFPIDLAEKDLRYAVAAASLIGAPVAATAGRVFAQAIRAGHGDDHLTGVLQLYDQPSPLSDTSHAGGGRS